MVGLKCPRCGEKLKIDINSKTLQILSCKCSKYPVYNDIVYLEQDNISKKAVDRITKGNNVGAIKTLMNLPLRLFLPFYILTQSNIAELLGFENTVRMLMIFGYEPKWSRYLLNRKNIPYYQISLASLELLKKADLDVLDVGCGAGIFLPEITRKLNPHSITCIDHSFFNLYLAKYFFGNINTAFICCDIEKRLPFDDAKYDFVHMSDTFQYVKDKKSLLKELSRIIKKSGLLSVPHTHKESTKTIFGVNKITAKNYLSGCGFKNIKIVNDSVVLVNLNLANITGGLDSDAYSIFASKKVVINSDLCKSKNFVLVSPHLDDAALSAGFLINKLKRAHFPVTILTIFNKGSSGPLTPQAETFIRSSGFKNQKSLFDAFDKEDARAMASLGVGFKHMGFIDAAFRKDERGRSIYNGVAEQFAGIISQKDDGLIKSVFNAIKKTVKRPDNIIFVCPVGIGGHVDHIIVREVVRRFKSPTIYWQDIPYNNSQNIKTFFSKNKHFNPLFGIDAGIKFSKIKTVKIYKSQMAVLFPDNKIGNLYEKYYSYNTK